MTLKDFIDNLKRKSTRVVISETDCSLPTEITFNNTVGTLLNSVYYHNNYNKEIRMIIFDDDIYLISIFRR